jgi:transcriptional regulator with XRE-family HTH domain
MNGMKTINQKQIAQKAGISPVMLSLILSGQRRAGWRTAKGLTIATGVPEVIWLESSLEEIKEALEQAVSSEEDVSSERK